MMILMTAALAAAQPAPAAGPMPNHTQHEQMEQRTGGHVGHMVGMSQEQMADCKKCCEEMMAKMHDGHAEHSGHKAQ